MTDKARELLERAMGKLYAIDSETEQLREEIRAYLAKPEVKPLSEKEINRELPINCSGDYSDGFNDGVRFAEKHHGVGGDDE